MNIKIYFLLILTGLVLNVSAFGQARDNTYLRMTNTSAKIVKGKITHREAIEYDYDGERLVCGYVLDISVVQSWKGGTEDFKVFSSNTLLFDCSAPPWMSTPRGRSHATRQ